MKMYCKKCSQFNTDDAMYCSNCGAALHDDANANSSGPSQAAANGYGAQPVNWTQPSYGPQYSMNGPERATIIERMKSVFSSKLCLAIAILLSISIVVSIVSPFILFASGQNLQTIVDSIYKYGQKLGIDQQVLQDIVNSVKDSDARLIVNINIPVVSIIACIALWMLIYDSKKGAAGQLNPRGINTLKTLVLVLLILICCGISLFALLLIPILLYDPIIIIPFLLLFGSLFALVITYYAKLYQTFKSISDTIRIGYFIDNVSMFVIVIFFIEAAFGLPLLSWNLIGSISRLISCAVDILAGILLLKYRNTMRKTFVASAL